MASPKKSPRPVPSSPRVANAHKGGIRISITNQHGQRYRYRAQAVSLSMRKGKLQVLESDGRCFLWFDHCDLEVRDARSNLLFHLKTGAVSSLPDAELVILADFAAAGAKSKARRKIPSRPPAAMPLAS